MLLVQVAYILAASLSQILIGYHTWQATLRLLNKLKLLDSEKPEINLIANFVLGLLVHLSAILLLKSLGTSWLIACLLPLLPCVLDYKLLIKISKSIRLEPSLNFCLWFLVTFFLGLSLIQTHDGIQTIWANNYGDACFHLGMISSFTFGANFPPELHIFSGTPLSYPFFMNLWSASIWWINPSYYSLSVIWMIQWMICWSLVFWLLRGQDNQLLPWAVLFGGGTFAYLFDVLGDPTTAPAHSFIEKGQPWAPFLTTVWIPQRTTQLGLLTTLAPLALFHKDRDNSKSLVLAGLILAFSVLAHTHFLLITTLYIIFLTKPKNLLPLLIALSPGLLFLPFILSKGGAFSLMNGWMDGNTFLMWAKNAPFWYLSLLALISITKNGRNIFVIFGLFIAANVFKIAFWEWDQIKIFIALYLCTISYWAYLESENALKIQILCVALILPGLFETCRVLQNISSSTMYTKAELKEVEEIKRITDPSDVILAKPDHNSAITLTGRKLYYGYEGTLWSHGIDHERRKKEMESLEGLSETCEEDCPNYLYWSNREKGYWKGGLPKGLKDTEVSYLKRF